MEKIKGVFFLLLLMTFTVNAQQTSRIRKGLIRTQLTISPSLMVSDNKSCFYLHGNVEGYLSARISISGEGYYYLGGISSTNNTFDYNHSAFLGASLHFTRNKSDLYVGMQPGFSFTRINKEANAVTEARTGTNPLFSLVSGYNFFAHSIFHFFVQGRLVAGQHNYDVHTNLTEFRFSAGLGFNINAIKEK